MVSKLKQEEIEGLRLSIYSLSTRDDENLISFLRGYEKGKGKSYNGFKIIQQYLLD